MAVGDVKGRVSVVDFDGKHFEKKHEHFMCQGQVNEIIWSQDEKMIIALGENKG